MSKIFLVRHASPDWNFRHIPYDIHPGPPLSSKGEKEAEAVAEFLQAEGTVKVYYSPFERSKKTAQIISTNNRIPSLEERRLAEWREVAEHGDKVSERMSLVFDEISKESTSIGPIALISHGGPIAFLLVSLGMEKDTLAEFKKKFDRSNPLPPAGVWGAEWDEFNNMWNLDLAFTPSMNEAIP